MSVLSSLFPPAITSSYALVFDIGSATVGVSFVRYKKDSPAEALFVHREIIHYGESTRAEDVAFAMNATVQKAGRTAIETIGRLPHVPSSRYAVHAIIHAPWAASHSTRAEHTLPKETTITKPLLKEFVARHFTQDSLTDRTDFDSHVTHVELNGYVTSDPYGKKAKSLAVTLLTSSMASVVYESMLDAFWQILPEHTVTFTPFMYAALELSELFHNTESFTLIDVGGTYTSISIVEDRKAIATSASNFGTEHLLDAVTQGDVDGRTTARSELNMFLNNTCTPSQCRKLENILKPVEQQWATAFGDASAQLAQEHKLPTRTFITVARPYGAWFERITERFDFGQFSVTGKALVAEPVTLEHTQRRVFFKNAGEYDLALALGILFVKG